MKRIFIPVIFLLITNLANAQQDIVDQMLNEQKPKREYVEYSFKKTPYTLKESLIDEIYDLREDSNKIESMILRTEYKKYDSTAQVSIHKIDSLIKLKTLEINQLEKGLKKNKVVRYDILFDYSSTNYYGGRIRKTDIVYYYPLSNNTSQSKFSTITDYSDELYKLSMREILLNSHKGIEKKLDEMNYKFPN
jgi:hypothetical protein